MTTQLNQAIATYAAAGLLLDKYKGKFYVSKLGQSSELGFDGDQVFKGITSVKQAIAALETYKAAV